MHPNGPRFLRRRAATTLIGASIFSALSLTACGDTTGPDGGPSRLVFVRSPSFDTLFVAEPNTGAVTRRIPLLLPTATVRVSPRGDRLALVRAFQLWVTDLDGGNPRRIAANVSTVTWSPDGGRLAYTNFGQPRHLRLINVDGSGDTVLPGATPGGFQGLAWSPDGGRIAFEGTRGGARTVYVVNTDGTGLRDIDQNLPGPESRSSGEPTWSPDGKQLAFHRFLRYSDTSQDLKLWVATLATGNAQPITTGSGNDVRPDWSPAGGLIAFLRFENGVSDVFVVRPDGTGLARVTDTPRDTEEHPGWLPD